LNWSNEVAEILRNHVLLAPAAAVALPCNVTGWRSKFAGKNTSSQGNNYTLFKLQDPGGCGAVNIFTWGHPKLSNGDDVRVEGVFETIHHQDRSIFYNQVEATKVIPLP
jgi:hypothetical protein